ncbi:MAG: glycosyltransferase family 4 protein [Candidatus Pacebacteria bacterium]|nr:glycosyltransferase family 4 protein [Candidatus Paceibacterota bacterium]
MSLCAKTTLDFQKISSRRILVCSTGGVPHRTLGASTVIFFNYLEQLKLRGFEVLHLLVVDAKNENAAVLAEYQKDLAEEGRFKVLVAKMKSLEQLSLSKKIKFGVLSENVIQQLKKFNPEIIFCLDITAAGVLRNYLQEQTKPKIIWLGDLRFQTAWYHLVYSIKEDWRNIIHFPPVWLVSRNWPVVYQQLLRLFNSVIVSSQSSEEQLKPLGINSFYLPYPWPTNPAAKSQITKIKKPQRPTFLFLGTLVALGSRSAFHFFLQEVYPSLVKIWGGGGFQILLCGSHGLPDWVKKDLADKPEIKYLGFVKDLEGLMAACHAVIVPIDVPVGNRSRIITAMAAGSLVIAHQNTALGNPDLVDGENCYLAHDGPGFVAKMKLAFDDQDEAGALVEKAKQLYCEKFEPEAAVDSLIKEIVKISE